jgi:hypothetical protein
MIAAILITGLVGFLLAMWLFVETMIYLRAGTRAFDRYTDTHPLDLPRPAPRPPADLPTPHSTWRTKGSRGQ